MKYRILLMHPRNNIEKCDEKDEDKKKLQTVHYGLGT